MDKAYFDMKAEALTARRVDQWLAGQISRRALVIPFGGPLPGGKAGLDLDGEYFDAETDLYGDVKALRASSWRFIDWHHDDAGVPPKMAGGPAISMKGVTIGEIELDDSPDEFGHWASWWIKQGQSRQALIAAKRVAALEQMGQPLMGSSQAVYKRKASDGHIEVWPVFRHTATTSPQNTYAVIPPLKGVLDAVSPDDLSSDTLKTLLAGLSELRDLGTDLHPTLPVGAGEGAAKSGRVLSSANEADIDEAVNALLGSAEKLRSVLARHRKDMHT